MLRLAAVALFAWWLPTRGAVGRGSPFGFVFDALRGDLGVSPTSGIDVAARVRVHFVGTLALLLAAEFVAWGSAAVVLAARSSRATGRASIVAVIAVPVVVGAVERWAGAVPTGAHLGASVAARAFAVATPAVAVGAAVAWLHVHRTGESRARAVVARDLPALFVGVAVGEVAFGRPGLATLFVDAVGSRDAILLRGVVLAAGALVVACGVAIGERDGRPRAVTSLRALGLAALVSAVGLAAMLLARSVGLPAPGAPRVRDAGRSPGFGVPLGSDADGHDVLARALDSLRGTFAVAGAALVVAALIAAVIGAIVGASRGRFERGLRRAVAAVRSAPLLLLAAAFLGAGGRAPLVVATALGATVVGALAEPIADAVDRGFRTTSRAPLVAAVPVVLGTAVSAMGTLVAGEMVLGLLGAGADGGATLGKELAAQLPSAATAPWGTIGPALVGAGFAAALVALGYGVVGTPSNSPSVTRSASDGRPHPGA